MYTNICIYIHKHICIYTYTYTGPPPVKEEALLDGDMQLPDNVLIIYIYL
jgi:hypothetical protein